MRTSIRGECIGPQSLTVRIAVAEVPRAIVTSLTDLETVAVALVSLFSMWLMVWSGTVTYIDHSRACDDAHGQGGEQSDDLGRVHVDGCFECSWCY